VRLELGLHSVGVWEGDVASCWPSEESGVVGDGLGTIQGEVDKGQDGDVSRKGKEKGGKEDGLRRLLGCRARRGVL
jgi:hypothetical protein